MVLRRLITAATLAVLSSNAMAMSVKFSWSGYQACSPRSPAFVVSDIPAETARLAFNMIDQNAPDYPHGGVSAQGWNSRRRLLLQRALSTTRPATCLPMDRAGPGPERKGNRLGDCCRAVSASVG